MRADDGWLAVALVPLLALVPVLWRVSRGAPEDRLIAQNLSSLLGGLALLPAAQGFGRPAYVDVALVLSVLGPTGTLIYARFLGVLPGSRLVRRAALLGVPAIVLPLCVAAGPGRAMAKLLLIGALLIAGSVVTGAGGGRGRKAAADGGRTA
ncbi:monovalent cation/H+ antiporter complex subunit F [Streptomyces sp. RTd22]|uniref:monovalent cation/H+ antiporter complex subunit F n=1 Tax=Streptomyces sp. RTd22 TaxID=1841249 RepID=UPI00099F4946|nr:monovalent cation/H+ antiporter complex subunit F [Streptomyces sp. RTd22]